MPIPQRFLGDDPMPAIGLGTWRLAGDSGARIVSDALGLGYRHLDTAQMYGNEAAIGAGMADSSVVRHEIFLTTKIDDHHHHPTQFDRSLDDSLMRLGTDYVDLLLIHWPVEWATMAETLESLGTAKADGRARHVGVSNFEPDQVEFALDQAPIEVNQIEYHPLLGQNELVEQARSHGLVITAYCPIARNEVAQDSACVHVAHRLGVTPAQVALGWLLAQGHVAAIPQTSNQGRLAENLAAGDLMLRLEDIEAINSTRKDLRIVSPAKSPWRSR